MSRGLMLFLAFVTGTGALTGCGGDDPMPPDEDLAPNLDGTYDLRAFTSALVTGGQTLEPPVVSGMFTLRQPAPTGSEAMGTFDLSITVPDGMGGNQSLEGQGDFTVRSDGTWEQDGVVAGAPYQGRGTYTFQNGTFTVVVTEPPLSVSTTVWQRR